jgi:hypothetical protein
VLLVSSPKSFIPEGLTLSIYCVEDRVGPIFGLGHMQKIKAPEFECGTLVAQAVTILTELPLFPFISYQICAVHVSEASCNFVLLPFRFITKYLLPSFPQKYFCPVSIFDNKMYLFQLPANFFLLLLSDGGKVLSISILYYYYIYHFSYY